MEVSATIPMWSRASDIRTIALGNGCTGQWLLSHLHEGDLPDAVWFILGTSIHSAIEDVILNDLSLEDMLASAHLDKRIMLAEADGDVIQQTSKRAKRGLHTLDDDIDRMCRRWWKDVHPSSPDRMEPYNDYAWPPVVEHEIDVGKGEMRLITTVDAIFDKGHRYGEEKLIIDWKSGSTKRAHPSQLQIYAYGLSKERRFDTDTQLVIGGFHHIDHSHIQYEYDYWGDLVVEGMIRATYAVKDGERYVFNPDWWCGYCVAKDRCPVKGDGDVGEVRLRLSEEAVRIEEPIEGEE